MARLCILFDLDGTLVDSEPLCNQAFLDLLPELADSVNVLVERYRGRRLAAILSDLEDRLGHPFPADFEKRYRRRVFELVSAGLRPMPGVREMLEATCYPRCIASSGPLEKIRHSLETSGLADYFGDRIFSSYEINSWKPDPGLFLHAAANMGFEPHECIVVEDSEVGIAAAHAAGIRALQFLPDKGQTDHALQSAFHDMAALPKILHQLSDADGAEAWKFANRQNS
jgi:HAD superfamily hydrolase (TIGR01509 family)